MLKQLKNNKLVALLLGVGACLTIVSGAKATAGTYENGIYIPDFPIVGSQVEVEITPFNLVEGAYQGRFVEQGIPGFATFNQKVATGDITAEDLVRAAFLDYRATYDDLMGYTDKIADVEQYLDFYRSNLD